MRPVYHLAQCNDCGKVWTAKNAVAAAVVHSKASGHEIVAEVILSGRWVGGVKQ